MLDYEGEVTVVMGRDAKNISEEVALDYVLGYTAGNDLSARSFQLPEASRMQFGHSKSFYQFGPIPYTIVTTSEIQDPKDLRLVAPVNGEVKQQTSTNDMTWSVRQIISHLSRGMTLRKGTVIMDGTPAGVGFFTKEFLKAGDVVEVEIEGVASVKDEIREHYVETKVQAGVKSIPCASCVLNPSGVRFGSLEIYQVIEGDFAHEVEGSLCVGQRRPSDNDEKVVLFLNMKQGVTFTADLVNKNLSWYFMNQVTVNFKKVELAVKQIISGIHVQP
ncbi:fumarylacetoacetate hydrolase family protein [Aspergillus flavus]|nr:uncharacterized protein G4B84_012291 [Aspergillus flavus NRRL3357]QMW36762.1 hypothetical protein G4B84_012291 [Aspergillus flavus NRRL3357]RAQ61996.1 fumarylacetoacetate hydrolase family protein [Aspergillus flavus]RAQ79063.1 fumarylacetoacetate hydrolase family protein [Aspergillus flavus]